MKKEYTSLKICVEDFWGNLTKINRYRRNNTILTLNKTPVEYSRTRRATCTFPSKLYANYSL